MTTKLHHSKTAHALSQYKIDNKRLLEFQMSGKLYRELSGVISTLEKEFQASIKSEV